MQRYAFKPLRDLLKASAVYIPAFLFKTLKETTFYNEFKYHLEFPNQEFCYRRVPNKKSSLTYAAKTYFPLWFRKNIHNCIREKLRFNKNCLLHKPDMWTLKYASFVIYDNPVKIAIFLKAKLTMYLKKHFFSNTPMKSVLSSSKFK